MYLDNDYFKKIKEAKAVVEEISNQEERMIELLNEVEVEEVDMHELALEAEHYVKKLLSDGAGRAGDAHSLDTGPMMKRLKKELAHVTADTIISLNECDGMTMEFLFHQPASAVGEYLIEMTEEV